MNTDDLTTEALRDLDAARLTELTDAERDRADAMFARIVAAPAGASADALVPVTTARRRGRRLLTGVGLAGAAGVAVPAFLLSGGSAFASWTATPEPLTDDAAAEAAATCRTHMAMPDRGERIVIAEQRGAWTLVMMAGPETEFTCLMADDSVDRFPHQSDGVVMAAGGGAVAAPPVARDDLDETTSMGGTVHDDEFVPWADDNDWFVWAEGHVGSDVTAVTVHTASGMEIEASVSDGRFAAWWPAGEVDSDNPELGGAWSYTLTLADGSTRDDAGCTADVPECGT
ncbi:MAG: hypothetical protein M3237_20360 [Actinomycetota bacterium]|nr:hypothetical protein [Actinomycetota bacterium]